MEDFEISYCTQNELSSVKELWKSVFKDDDIFINQFFYHLYQDNILICKVNGEIVAMATLLPATFILKGKEYKMHYLYACATAPHFRGRKIMPKILDRAFEDTVSKGWAGLFLLPANDELYDFYEKNGFKEFFYHDRQEFFFPNSVEKKGNHYQLQKISAKKYYELRYSYLQNENSIHYPLSHFEFTDDAKVNYPAKFYEVLYSDKNAAIGFIEEKSDHILVKELLCKRDSVEILYAINQHFEKGKIILNSLGKTYRDAMLRSNEQAFFEKEVTGYFNIALD